MWWRDWICEAGTGVCFPKLGVVLGQHVMVGPAGTVAGGAGPITSAADSLQIRLFGRGPHGSMPQASVDPVVMAAAIVLRLQTIVSREVAATDAAVVTVGVLQAGTKENVIPDEAIIKLNIYAKAKAAGRINELPVNHSPFFAPVINPTLQTGIEAMVAGALAWLAK
jgi:metal-dependent amidase/aminoacylase/carboxypeptidase family protein